VNQSRPDDPVLATILRRLDELVGEASRLRAEIQDAMTREIESPFWPERRRTRVPVADERRK
jgi:hypothetical protein